MSKILPVRVPEQKECNIASLMNFFFLLSSRAN
jgi:hypothetical protein